MSEIRAPQPDQPPSKKPPRRHWYAKEAWFDLKFSHYVEIALTVALVGIAFFQYQVYKRQAGIMQTQADIAATQNDLTAGIQRAFISFHHFNIRHELGPQMPSPFDGKMTELPWRFEAVWENTGNTPTVNLAMYSALEGPIIGDQPNDPDFKIPESRHDFHTFIAPRDKAGGYAMWTSENFVNQLTNGRAIGYVYGQAEYDDVFKAHHITKFCRRIYLITGDLQTFFPKEPNPAVTPYYRQCERDNCADGECRRK